MLRISAGLAIGFGALGALFELPHRGAPPTWWPLWVADYVAAALLVAGGVAVLRGRSSLWLAGGWGFACAVFWLGFFGRLSALMRGELPADPSERRFTIIMGVMLAAAIVGFVGTLLGRPRRA